MSPCVLLSVVGMLFVVVEAQVFLGSCLVMFSRLLTKFISVLSVLLIGFPSMQSQKTLSRSIRVSFLGQLSLSSIALHRRDLEATITSSEVSRQDIRVYFKVKFRGQLLLSLLARGLAQKLLSILISIKLKFVLFYYIQFTELDQIYSLEKRFL